jgi:hypothetical protein
MATLISHRIRIRYQGGTADNQELELYDGTTSIHGFAQALQITTHAYLHNEIVTRATALRGARYFLRPAKPGSFISEFVVLIEQYPATSTLVGAIGAPVFYDFIKISMRKAAGLFAEDEPETKHVSDLLDRQEPFFDELAEVLEGSLQRAHRPIGDSVTTATLERPRAELIVFNAETKGWVNTRDEMPESEDFSGNVTRYNAITRNGRAYINQIGRIVPFKLDPEFPIGKLGFLTWSLHGRNTDIENQLKFVVREVKSASDRIKRVIIKDCDRA